MSGITAQGIEERLRLTLAPQRLAVVDESAAHAGHMGSNGSLSGTHFRLQIALGQSAPTSRVGKHRLVYDALQFEMANGVHALAIEFLD